MSLAKTLKEIRKLRGFSLRQVEETTGISNAYLSQLERSDDHKPSPDKLQELAECYGVPYADLMRAAGYLKKLEPASEKRDEISAYQTALMSANLTPEEEEAVVKYIQFLRYQAKQ